MRVNILGVGFDNVTMEQAVAEGVRLLRTEGGHYAVTPTKRSLCGYLGY